MSGKKLCLVSGLVLDSSYNLKEMKNDKLEKKVYKQLDKRKHQMEMISVSQSQQMLG